MRLIVLTGEPKVGKTNALKLLEKVNDSSIEYFQDDIRVSDLLELTLRDEKLGVVTTNDERILKKVDSSSVFIISRNRWDAVKQEKSKLFVSTFLNQSEKLDWTEAFNWLKFNFSEKEKPAIADEVFNFICGR